MLTAKITNMACGHCRLKIESELQEVGFQEIKFDMLSDLVQVEEGTLTSDDFYQAIQKAGYIVDRNYVAKSNTVLIKFEGKLTPKEASELAQLLESEHIEIVRISDDGFEVEVLRGNKEPFEIIELIEVLGLNVVRQ